MLKELQQLFRRKNLIEEAMDASLEMLREDLEMFNESVKSLRHSDTEELSFDIEEKDAKINEYEREVRKKVLTHLAVNDVSDLNPGLVLVSIVIDIERIGDYTKNIVDLAQIHPGRLQVKNWEEQVASIEETISKNFALLIQAFEQANTEPVKTLHHELWKAKKQCDSINMTLLKSEELDFKPNDAVAFALYMRYLKRVAGHLMNIATSLVNPFHKIGYRID